MQEHEREQTQAMYNLFKDHNVQGLLEPTLHMSKKKKLMMDGYMPGLMTKCNSSADLLSSYIKFKDID